MLTGINLVNIADLISELGEVETKNMLSQFSCPLNADVEDFIRNRAIEFSKQAITRTHLVYVSHKKEKVLVAYFALCQKCILLKKDVLSKTLQRRVAKFGSYIPECQGFMIGAPLIAQLSKNYTNGYNELIKGDEVIEVACDIVSKYLYALGGKVVYLECEDEGPLKDFYSRNGFKLFGSRKLERHDIGFLKRDYLLQYLRYL
jgi:hypothetical protein